jgi:O-antigen/teichoic acid export membrane protein
MAMQVQAYYDQVLLAGMREPGEVGIYAAALRIVALLGFVPMAVYTAAAPEITRAHQADRGLYARRLRDVYRVMLLAFALMALPMVLVPDVLIRWTVGDDYLASAALLPWLSLRLLLTNLGVARGLHLTNEGLFMHGLLTAVAGMVVNLSLNAFLIPIYGAHGCVASALISFTVNVLLLEWLDKRARFSLNVLGAAVGLCRLPR